MIVRFMDQGESLSMAADMAGVPIGIACTWLVNGRLPGADPALREFSERVDSIRTVQTSVRAEVYSERIRALEAKALDVVERTLDGDKSQAMARWFLERCMSEKFAPPPQKVELTTYENARKVAATIFREQDIPQ